MTNVVKVSKEIMHIKALKAMVAAYDKMYLKSYYKEWAHVVPFHARAKMYREMYLRGITPQVLKLYPEEH